MVYPAEDVGSGHTQLDRRASARTGAKLSKWLPTRPTSPQNQNIQRRPQRASGSFPGISISPSSSTESESRASYDRPLSPISTPRGNFNSRNSYDFDTRSVADSVFSHQHSNNQDDWTEFNELEEEGQDIKTKGKRFLLRRSKSGLRLFGKDKQNHHSADGPSSSSPREIAIPEPKRKMSTSSSIFHFSSSPNHSNHPYLDPQSAHNGSTSKIGGWWSNMLHSASSSHLPMQSNESVTSTLPPPTARPSPKKSSTGRLGPFDRMLDKAAAYFLDSDAGVDKCPDDIWVLGVKHPGYVHVDAENPEGRRKRMSVPAGRQKRQDKWKPESTQLRSQRHSSPPIPLNSGSSSPTTSLSNMSLASSSSVNHDLNASSFQLENLTINGWPAMFYQDFYSRIALVYRGNFPPIPCSAPGGVHGMLNSLSLSIGRSQRTADGLSSDAGWGCMLRTGQSLLANTLIHLHLGRNWRRGLPEFEDESKFTFTAVEPNYARILSLFIDDPSPIAPFSVHRFALTGKQLGKEVGEWFGPSTAAGAIKALVTEYEPSGLVVENCQDTTIYHEDILDVTNNWEKPVLILLNLRLGIDGVNPVYHEALKSIFQYPQCVGIAGGRPSSSYYFVGVQKDSLFYIDPHHSRAAIPLNQPPPDLVALSQSTPLSTPLTNGREKIVENGSNVGSYVEVGSFPSIASGHSGSSVRLTSLERLGIFFSDAYSDESLRSYHCDKVRKMQLSSLDPSMLLGFLVRDASDWLDFVGRVQEVAKNHKQIFAVAECPPEWMRRSRVRTNKNTNATIDDETEESDKGIESFSESEIEEEDSGNEATSKDVEDEDWVEEGDTLGVIDIPETKATPATDDYGIRTVTDSEEEISLSTNSPRNVSGGTPKDLSRVTSRERERELSQDTSRGVQVAWPAEDNQSLETIPRAV